MNVSIIIPTYNERGNLPVLVKRLHTVVPDAEIVIVDDNSLDGTGKIADRLAQKYTIKVIHRPRKLGLSTAVVDGFRAAKGDILGVMDADLSHPPEMVPRLIKPIQDGTADIVVASRYMKGGRIEYWPWNRRMMSRIATWMSRMLTRLNDPCSGFFFVSKNKLKGMCITSNGYKIMLEILVRKPSLKKLELPYSFADRSKGKSKLNVKECRDFMLDWINLIFPYRHLFFRRPLLGVVLFGLVAQARLHPLAVFRSAVNLLRNGIFSESIRLSASSICNLNCPACPTALGINRKNIIGHGVLEFSQFESIIRKNSWIRHIELSHYGELFTNPELAKIMEFAKVKGISLTANNGVNLNNVDARVAEALVINGFRSINISIDAATETTYQKYRRGGSLRNVIKNIKAINYHKNKHNSKYPLLTWYYLIFPYNRQELPRAKRMAKKLKMRFKVCKGTLPSKHKDYDVYNLIFHYSEILHIRNRIFWTHCSQMWLQPQINWNGDLTGCCANRYYSFGNVHQLGLIGILKSDNYKDAKCNVLTEPWNNVRQCLPCLSQKLAVSKHQEKWISQ